MIFSWHLLGYFACSLWHIAQSRLFSTKNTGSHHPIYKIFTQQACKNLITISRDYYEIAL
jgi:hypothetical protein